MAETNESEGLPKQEHTRPEHDHAGDSEPTNPLGEGQEVHDEGDPIDPDIRTGFSAEQRRFLWTLTGLNVVAVLLGAAIIVGYQATARSQDQQVVRLSDASRQADAAYQRTEQNNMGQMIQAAIMGNRDAITELRQEVFDAYKDDLDAEVAYRRARGLTAEEPSQEQLEDFMKRFDDRFAQNLRMYTASTQPASKPADKSAPAKK